MLSDQELVGIFKALTKNAFSELWKGRELREFYVFVREQGVPSGGFCITFPIALGGTDCGDDQGYVWFFYRISGTKGERVFMDAPKVYVPVGKGGLKKQPPEWKKFPVWRFNLKSSSV